jgi:hypothetical protein
MKLLTLLFVILVTACQTLSIKETINVAKPISQDRVFAFADKPQKTFSTLKIARGDSFFGGGCYLNLYIDDKLTAKVDTEEFVLLYLPVGIHFVSIGFDLSGNGLCAASDQECEQKIINIEGGQLVEMMFNNTTNGIKLQNLFKK